MKPIRLSIKGINSFEQEQTIDFLKLTKNGFFGIFGPTGSGKSTILDGITLALYGGESRNSADFINVNTDRAYVEFEFQISGSQNKRYMVQREYKRSKDTLKPRHGKCKLVELTYEEPEILEESVSAINKRCEEIIGLNEHDFTRTVVLPQGKFSEFLKMEGKNRRDMLERLFNLYDYGENLRVKLNRSIDIEKDKLIRLEGELAGIGDISDENLKVQEELVDLTSKAFKDEKADLEKLKENYEVQKEIFNWQNEMNEHITKLDELNKDSDYITEEKTRVEIYKKANTVKESILDFENLLKERDKKQESLKDLESKKKVSRENLDDITKMLEKAKEDNDTKKPELLIKKQNLLDALDTVKELNDLSLNIKKYILMEKDTVSNLETKEKDKEVKEIRLKDIIKDIEKINGDIGALKVSARLKEEISKGYQLESEFNKEKKRHEKLVQDFNNTNLQLGKCTKEKDKLSKDFELLIKTKEDIEIKIKDNLDNAPISQEKLLELRDELKVLSSSWDSYGKLTDKIENNIKILKELELEKKSALDIKRDLEEKIDALKKQVDKAKVENLASELRKSLMEGENCPVCGSLDHPYIHRENIKAEDNEKFEEMEIKLKETEKKLKETEGRLIKISEKSSNVCAQNNELNLELEGLGKDFLSKPFDKAKFDYDNLVVSFKNFESKKVELDEKLQEVNKNISSFEKDIAILETKISNFTSQIDAIKTEGQALSKEIKAKEIELKNLKEELNLSDFEKTYKEIQDKDKQREILEEQLEENAKERTVNQELIDKIDKEIITLKNELISIVSKKENLSGSYDDKKSKVISKVGPIENIESALLETKKEIDEIEGLYLKLDKKYKELTDEFNSLKEEYIKIDQNLSDLGSRIDKSKITIKSEIERLGFEGIESVKENFRDISEIEGIEKKIKDFEEAVSKYKSIIANYKGKLEGKSIDKEDFYNLTNEKLEKEESLKKTEEKLILETQNLAELKKKLDSVKTILDKKKAVEKRQGILKDLESLFKGKKFIDFISVQRLKYISREASNRLLDITSGAYSIETDDNARFLIKDNKNGGILRESSTLSGGETFLASLALALSLSAEIQLKGTAPLELFFLDEGFGTLDENLLDVVMNSLEKIHNEKLKVGLISHVDSVKQRVPVKLIVTPAKSGICGSSIKIEHN